MSDFYSLELFVPKFFCVGILLASLMGSSAQIPCDNQVLVPNLSVHGLSVATNGTVYYVDYFGGTLGFLDLQNGRLNPLVSGLNSPASVKAFGDKVYFTESGTGGGFYRDGALSVFDAQTTNRTLIATGLQYPVSLFVNMAGDVYVLEAAGSSTIYGGYDRLLKFPAGSNQSSVVIPSIPTPVAVVLDSQGRIIIGSYGRTIPGDDGSLLAYTPGSTNPVTLASGLPAVQDLTIDASDNLYVAGRGTSGGPMVAIAKLLKGASSFMSLSSGLQAWCLALDSQGDIYYSTGPSPESLRRLTPCPRSPLGVVLSSPVNDSVFILPKNIPLTATVSESGGTVTNVTFLDVFLERAQELAQPSAPPFAFIWTNPAPGFHTLFAVARDSTGIRATSAAANVTIVAAGISTTLHSFSPATYDPSTGVGTNSDGTGPGAGLILSGNSLYGTTQSGGPWGGGTLFSVETDGSGFKILHAFTAGSGATSFVTNNEGAVPSVSVIESGGTLYGTAKYGGTSGSGTVFALRANGTGLLILHSFTELRSFSAGSWTNSDGGLPGADLLLSGNTLYGTTGLGGDAGYGTLFAVNTDGTGFATLHSFSSADGAYPVAGLRLSGTNLYGMAHAGGSGCGTMFKVSTNGTGFAVLHSFTGNEDGAYPDTRLVLSGSRIYGATDAGGDSGYGTVFAVNTDGTGLTNLHSFALGEGISSSFDGGLILSDNTLYGTKTFGGDLGNGTVFALGSDSTGFVVLHSFTRDFCPDICVSGHGSNWDGTLPQGDLTVLNNHLYGTASYGGAFGGGTIFSIALPVAPPRLAISMSEGNIILRWPTNFTGFTLQSTTNLTAPFWTTNFVAPVVVSGQYTVTNPILHTQEFLRLGKQ